MKLFAMLLLAWLLVELVVDEGIYHITIHIYKELH